MEQLFFSAANFAKAKSLGQGQVNISELLRKIEALDSVDIQTELPSEDLLLSWTEYHSPKTQQQLGQALLSGRLMDYKFQYFGTFALGEQEIPCRNWLSQKQSSQYETFEANLGQERLHRHDLESEGQNVCNCSWLLDFLQNAQAIDADPMRKEMLVWRKTVNGYQLTLKLETQTRYEQEEFVFHPDMKALKWEHKVVLFKKD